MEIVSFAGNIEQWRLPGDPARGGDIDAPGDDLSKGQHFQVCRDRQIFADQPSIRCPVRHDYLPHYEDGPPRSSDAEGRNLDAIFAEKIPKIKDEMNDKWLVGAEILAYLKWLIYTAAFKDPSAEPRGSTIRSFSEAGAERFAPMKILSSESCRSSWSAGMPTSAEQEAFLIL